MISDIAAREDELGGKTLLIVGPRPHRRAAGAARQGVRHARHRHPPRSRARRRRRRRGVTATTSCIELLAQADVVALTCPLTPETENLIDAKALAAMKPTAHLINVARGVSSTRRR